jgi:hypothetical protein
MRGEQDGKIVDDDGSGLGLLVECAYRAQETHSCRKTCETTQTFNLIDVLGDFNAYFTL